MRANRFLFLIKLIGTISFLTCICYSPLKAQVDSTSRRVRAQRIYLGRLLYGSIFAHSIYIKNTAGAHPRGGELEISTQLTDEKTFAKCNCYPRIGYTVSYFDFNTPLLGKSFSGSYFIEPNFRISSRSAFFINAGGGLSFLTNPFDSLKNPENHTYSLPINFFLHLGVGLNYRVNNKVSADLTAAFEHNSNGNFAQPNRGINWPAATLTLRYNTAKNILPQYIKQKERSWKGEKLKVDAGIFYSPKAGYNLDTTVKRKNLVGTTIQVSKKVSGLSALSASTEIYYDGAFLSVKKIINDNSSAIIAGISLGHEFLFKRFIFSQQLGIYVHKNSETYTKLYHVPFGDVYHRWTLRYKIVSSCYAGISLMAREDIADFVDIRVMYRF